jgi:hypothetical protein
MAKKPDSWRTVSEREYGSEKEPWAAMRWLLRVRNGIAHAKSELVVREKLINDEE